MEPIRPFDMLLTLDGQGPRYAQITRALRAAIQDDVLPAGTRLPPTRDFARSLGCSRNIVLLAYEQLLLEGYLSTRQGAGTFVSPDLPTAEPSAARGTAGAEGRCGCRNAAARQRDGCGQRAGGDGAGPQTSPSISCTGSANPIRASSRIVRAAFNTGLRARAFRYGPPAGDPRLRQQIADRIRAARGIARTADDIVVTSGAQQALDICARLLLDPGDQRGGGRSGICVRAGGLQRRRREADPRPGRRAWPRPGALASGQGPGARDLRHTVAPVSDRRGDAGRAAPRAARLGEAPRRLRHRRRLRRRVPLSAAVRSRRWPGWIPTATSSTAAPSPRRCFRRCALDTWRCPRGSAKRARARQVALRSRLLGAVAADAGGADGDRRVRSPHSADAEALSASTPGRCWMRSSSNSALTLRSEGSAAGIARGRLVAATACRIACRR